MTASWCEGNEARILAGVKAYFIQESWWGHETPAEFTLQLIDCGDILEDPFAGLLLVEIDQHGSRKPAHVVPLIVGIEPVNAATDSHAPVICSVGDVAITDGMHDARVMHALRQAVHTNTALTLEHGELLLHRHASVQGDPGNGDALEIHTESTNILAIMGTEQFKIQRAVEWGDVIELTRIDALIQAGFARMPRLLGWIEYRRTHEERTLVGILSEHVPGSHTGWEQARNAASAFAKNPADTLVEEFESSIMAIATMTAQMHDAFLTTPTPYHKAVRASQEEVAGWAAVMLAGWDECRSIALRAGLDISEAMDRTVRALYEETAAMTDVGMLSHVHGDFHLGQTIWSESRGWNVVDFAGDPVLPLEVRNGVACPLRDVASFLRSLDYAVVGQLHERGNRVSAEQLDEWSDRLHRLFWTTYMQHVHGRWALPRTDVHAELVFTAFQCEKACWQLSVELQDRPEWADVPYRFLQRLTRARDVLHQASVPELSRPESLE